ncbi:hypothetical protein QN084_09050 [Paenarthrobacter sp. R1]|uniref:hypothetical protein n=1 Tax=Paenarthrobacter sp. R1 TaxID=3049085 RepID=UPI002557BB64|nr:hypothetical protein [Paenarthrobacter sp. R1]WIV32729.1 hypothetical protein QN084_09050 [Paenarthrobacter sp. R1]
MNGQECGAVMRAGLGLQSTTAIAAACLLFSTWVAGCTASPEAVSPSSTPFVSAAGSTGPQNPDEPISNSLAPPVSSATPQPDTTPRNLPPSGDPGQPSAPGPLPGSGGAVSSGAATSGAGTGGGASGGGGTDAVPGPSTPTDTSQGASSPADPGTAVEPSPGPSASPSAGGEAARAAVVPPQVEPGPAVYYVAINDGGSRGVRFGCNDSLVPVRGPASSGDPLTVALGRLLGAGLPVDNDAALYDSLAASSLHFVSGYVSGSTVVVNLGGSIRPGGVCDIPRIEAKLTHTVVAASGATRAEIYVNGMTLDVALSLR